MTFDMKTARALCNQATFKATGNPINEDLKLLVDQAGLLPAALDRIAELEEALIEERARRIYPYSIPTWDRLPEEDHTKQTFGGMRSRMGKASYRHAARDQLHSEGKI